MTTLHTFGCSITQGFALPDVVRRHTPYEIEQLGRPLDWTDVHLYQPSALAWPQVLADRLGMSLVNHARRGACWQQIARQCAVADIQSGDTVIVMWTYLCRLSLQWPARTAVPFANIVNPDFGWQTIVVGMNKLFGLSPGTNTTPGTDQHIQQYIEDATRNTYLDPMGMYNRYYNSLVLQTMTDGFLSARGARVIHVSVEPESALKQLEQARLALSATLREPHVIPHPREFAIPVDHTSCMVIHDVAIPPAEGDTHPSVQHHKNFAQHLDKLYFSV